MAAWYVPKSFNLGGHMKHLQLILWAFGKIWAAPAIGFFDRFLLWKKTIKLHFAFAVFTDPERPPDQLEANMLHALLCAIYDYDSDWPRGDRKGGNFAHLVPLIACERARDMGLKLFRDDVAGDLQEDGLNRGGIALVFYQLLVQSRWLGAYKEEQIYQFGCDLQIIDDLLDLEKDRRNNDTNCFRLPGREAEFAARVRSFMQGAFFGRLVASSRTYKWYVAKAVNRILDQIVPPKFITVRHLWKAGRPKDALYACVLTYVGFSIPVATIYTPGHIQALTCGVFALMTMSIMVFNDWVDRDVDANAGRRFASVHHAKLMRHWRHLTAATIVPALPLSLLSPRLGMLVTGVWVLGHLYSAMRKLVVLNTLTVAACAASPALTGSVYHGDLNLGAGIVFAMFFVMVLAYELYKDILERDADRGNKATIPLLVGADMALFPLLPLAALVLAHVVAELFDTWSIAAFLGVLFMATYLIALFLAVQSKGRLFVRGLKRFTSVMIATVLVTFASL